MKFIIIKLYVDMTMTKEYKIYSPIQYSIMLSSMFWNFPDQRTIVNDIALDVIDNIITDFNNNRC